MPRPEQTEKATPRKKSQARAKGQIARSPDLTSAAVFLTVISVLHLMLMPALARGGDIIAAAVANSASREPLTIKAVSMLLGTTLFPIALPLGLLFMITMIVAIGVNVGQVGIVFTGQPLQPNFSRVNPLTGLKRLFSAQILVNLAKQVFKLTAVSILFYDGVHGNVGHFYSLSEQSPGAMIHFVDDLLYGIGVRFGVFLLVIGFFDFLWERKRLADSLKMTKIEVRDEARQSEGSSEAKQVFRRRQRELSRRRMMTAVPKATVVITNPTHFAVALLWEEDTMAAPVVVAKGADLMAKRIRELARKHEVPIIENPPLARTLYKDVPLDTPIPPALYAGVAKIIAFIFALKTRPAKGGLAALVPPRPDASETNAYETGL